MAPADHTFDAKCRQTPVTFPDRGDGMPPMEAQFFYSSTIPIDDPLSASINAGTPDKRSSKSLLRPFGRGDNNALESAWLRLGSDYERFKHQSLLSGKENAGARANNDAEKRHRLVDALAEKHSEQHAGVSRNISNVKGGASSGVGDTTELCCTGLHGDISDELARSVCSLSRAVDARFDKDALAKDVSAIVLNRHKSTNWQSTASFNNQNEQGTTHSGSGGQAAHRFTTSSPPKPEDELLGGREAIPINSTRRKELKFNTRDRSTSQVSERSTLTSSIAGSRDSPRQSLGDDGLTGKPFIRVGNAEPARSYATSNSAQGRFRADSTATTDTGLYSSRKSGPKSPQQDLASTESNVPAVSPTKDSKSEEDSIQITVGISRLHMVVLPALQMKPIYWSPINDMAVVTRATWFYRDTMLPVSPAVANQLEAGYQELRPWSDTWIDELRCALEIGAAGEEKVTHELWPTHFKPLSRTSRDFPEPRISADLYCSARCFQGDAAAQGKIDYHGAQKAGPTRPFANYHAIYKDEKAAFLLKPTLKPSAYYGRRPVAKILRGATVGVPVVRGFNRRVWNKIHGSKNATGSTEESVAIEGQDSDTVTECPACKAEKDRGQITDLVLVAHGIGQKFAERVESFHFTHAINSFRRAVNIELGNPAVQKALREDQNGLMILPLNWRMGVSFADGGGTQDGDGADYSPQPFDLKDIEPNTIPAVRSMISDVMFDIPFYMSHHKIKMITALVSEANRVFRLWCQNNPGFCDRGRVHLIAHSLGSVMTIDILSRQPTRVPKLNPLSPTPPSTEFFEFDTTNLFLVGSPVGFFLLLEKGCLVPREGRAKADASSSDAMAKRVVGDAGTFGCLAVDNLYNILAKEDPIAYLLTGAVDPEYAAGLKTAYVPSTATSFMTSIGSAIRQIIPGMSTAPDPFAVEPERPSTVRLPSQLELEVHDFPREEMAEKKAFLLNDNGQIDWFLRSTGGPLEIQYLNMLSAHTSYWTNQDFIRMICFEVGRKPGRKNTLPAMRAVKATKTDSPK